MAFFIIDDSYHGKYPHEVPTISSIVPNNIPWNDLQQETITVDVYGTGFVNSSTVWISSAQFNSFVRLSKTHLQLLLTSSNCTVGSHSIYVHNTLPGGGNSSNFSITIIPTSHINSVSPIYKLTGDGLNVITLTGTGFIESSIIKVNNNNVTTTYVNPTTLTFSAQEVNTAGQYSLTVYNSNAPISNTYVLYTWNSGLVPHVSSISPSSANCGLDDYVIIHVYGTGFIPTSYILYTVYPWDTTFIDDTHLVMSRGIYVGTDWGVTYQIGVSNPSPGLGNSNNTIGFPINAIYPVPTLTSITDYPGNPLLRIITGTGFQPALDNSNPITYLWDKDASTGLDYIGVGEYIDATHFYWNTSGYAYKTYHIGMRNMCGGDWSGTYTYTLVAAPNPVPSITSFDPASISCPLDPNGFSLNIYGNSFVSNATVEVYITVNGGRYDLTVQWQQYISISEIYVVLTYHIHYGIPGLLYFPMAFGDYTVKITNPGNPNGGGSTTHTFTLTPTTPTPIVSNINPQSGNMYVLRTITGNNFTSQSVIFIKLTTDTQDPNNNNYMGGALSTTYVSTTQLKLTDGIFNTGWFWSAGTYMLCVYTPCGGISNWQQFTIT